MYLTDANFIHNCIIYLARDCFRMSNGTCCYYHAVCPSQHYPNKTALDRDFFSFLGKTLYSWGWVNEILGKNCQD